MDERASAEVESARPPAPARPAARKLVKWGIGAVLLVAAIVGGVIYWSESQHAVSTENAYVNANRIDIAPQVAGPIVAVPYTSGPRDEPLLHATSAATHTYAIGTRARRRCERSCIGGSA